MFTAMFGNLRPEALIVVGVGALIVFFIGRKIIKKLKGAAKDALGDKLGDMADGAMDDD